MSQLDNNFILKKEDNDRKKLIGLYGREGLNTLKNQLTNHYEKINFLFDCSSYFVFRSLQQQQHRD